MNLFSNSNVSWGDTTTQKESPKTVLFSGFLITLLGISGMQPSITGRFDTLTSTPGEEAITAPVCDEHLGVKAIISDSSLHNTKNSAPQEAPKEEQVSKECEQKEKLKTALEQEVKLTEMEESDPRAEAKRAEQEAFQKKVADLEKMLKGHPLEKMASEIAKQDPEIAALIVGIARKESQWGLRSPKKNGDCFNYWGYKGAGDRGVGMGYACFATREEAVEKIAARLEKMIDKRGSSKPSALVTPWKCGSSCATHSPESVRKWVSDVNQYYTKVLAMK